MTGEIGLDEPSEGIDDISKDLGGVFLHVITNTE